MAKKKKSSLSRLQKTNMLYDVTIEVALPGFTETRTILVANIDRAQAIQEALAGFYCVTVTVEGAPLAYLKLSAPRVST